MRNNGKSSNNEPLVNCHLRWPSAVCTRGLALFCILYLLVQVLAKSHGDTCLSGGIYKMYVLTFNTGRFMKIDTVAKNMQ